MSIFIVERRPFRRPRAAVARPTAARVRSPARKVPWGWRTRRCRALASAGRAGSGGPRRRPPGRRCPGSAAPPHLRQRSDVNDSKMIIALRITTVIDIVIHSKNKNSSTNKRKIPRVITIAFLVVITERTIYQKRAALECFGGALEAELHRKAATLQAGEHGAQGQEALGA